jgi:hypothetical protein
MRARRRTVWSNEGIVNVKATPGGG